MKIPRMIGQKETKIDIERQMNRVADRLVPSDWEIDRGD